MGHDRYGDRFASVCIHRSIVDASASWAPSMVDRPGILGFQADMAHTLLYTLGYNAQEDRIVPQYESYYGEVLAGAASF